MGEEVSKQQADGLLEILSEHIKALHAIAAKLETSIEPVTMGLERASLMPNVKLYALLKYVKGVTTEVERLVNICEPKVAERVIKCMVQDDIPSLQFGGYTYAPDTKVYVSVTADNKQKVLAWLQSHPSGKEIVKLDYHHKTFETFIKNLKQNGEELPKEVNTYEAPTLDVRKMRKS